MHDTRLAATLETLELTGITKRTQDPYSSLSASSEPSSQTYTEYHDGCTSYIVEQRRHI